MYKFVIKKFVDNKKLEEAKKKALEIYEKMRVQEKIDINRKIEKQIFENQKEAKKTFKIEEYSTDEIKNQVEDIVGKFQFIEKPTHKNPDKSQEELKTQSGGKIRSESRLNLNYYNKIDNDTLMYKLNDYYKNLIDEEKWLKIYEIRYDPNFEKLIQFLLNLFKFIIFYKTFFYIKKFIWNYSEKKTLKEYVKMIFFYSFAFGFYLVNMGFYKRSVTKILVKGDKIRVYFYNMNKTSQNKVYKEIPIENLRSITSKSKGLNEILYLTDSKKVGQMFAQKNAFYDKAFLVNLCSPQVKRVKFTNVDLDY
jgi:hypothetical protein